MHNHETIKEEHLYHKPRREPNLAGRLRHKSWTEVHWHSKTVPKFGPPPSGRPAPKFPEVNRRVQRPPLEPSYLGLEPKWLRMMMMIIIIIIKPARLSRILMQTTQATHADGKTRTAIHGQQHTDSNTRTAAHGDLNAHRETTAHRDSSTLRQRHTEATKHGDRSTRRQHQTETAAP